MYIDELFLDGTFYHQVVELTKKGMLGRIVDVSDSIEGVVESSVTDVSICEPVQFVGIAGKEACWSASIKGACDLTLTYANSEGDYSYYDYPALFEGLLSIKLISDIKNLAVSDAAAVVDISVEQLIFQRNETL